MIGFVPAVGPLQPGELIQWVDADYVEDGVGAVTAGAKGKFITIDGGSEADGVVVSFDAVGTFCCPRANIDRVDGA